MRAWKTERLVLLHPESVRAQAVREYGLASRDYHAPWEPVRPDDWWDSAVVAARLRLESAQAAEDKSLALYLAARRDPTTVIGKIALNNFIRGAFQACSAGYGLAPAVVGSGYMTEALTEAIRIAFEELRMHRVEVNVVPRNHRSIAVAERTGFEREGVSRRYLNIAGVWEDHVRFARINDDWRPLT